MEKCCLAKSMLGDAAVEFNVTSINSLLGLFTFKHVKKLKVHNGGP